MRTRILAALAILGPLAGACRDAPRTADRAEPDIAVTDAVTGLGSATDLGFLPDGRMVVTEKDGRVVLVAPGDAPEVAGTFQVDTESEKGLLGVVVPPSFAEDRRIVLYLSVADAAGGSDLDRNRVISVVLGDDDRLDPASVRVLVSGLRGPRNHDGGALALGPDGKLYVGAGDTGCNSGRPPSTEEPTNYFATCLTNGNGKILRVNLDGSIPEDNPLSDVAEASACGAGCGDAVSDAIAPPRRDLWAWGFRNPWRFAFDPVTGRLWVGDVGEVSYEEIGIAERGRHHGWPWREGPHGWPVDKCRETVPDTGPCVEPAYHCARSAEAGIDGGCVSITGGAFLVAPRWPDALRGRYVFGDNATGTLYTLELSADRLGVVPGSRRELARVDGSPVSIRPGPDGDLFVAVLPGRVLRLSPSGAR